MEKLKVCEDAKNNKREKPIANEAKKLNMLSEVQNPKYSLQKRGVLLRIVGKSTISNIRRKFSFIHIKRN